MRLKKLPPGTKVRYRHGPIVSRVQHHVRSTEHGVGYVILINGERLWEKEITVEEPGDWYEQVTKEATIRRVNGWQFHCFFHSASHLTVFDIADGYAAFDAQTPNPIYSNDIILRWSTYYPNKKNIFMVQSVSPLTDNLYSGRVRDMMYGASSPSMSLRDAIRAAEKLEGLKCPSNIVKATN